MIKKNSLVRIGKGRKVYRVAKVTDPAKSYPAGTAKYILSPDAKHPDAAVRVPDALHWYRRDELVEVTA